MRIRPFLLLIAFGLAAYHNGLAGPFLFDDKYAILENPSIRRLWPFGQNPKETPMDTRPVTLLSLSANYALGGLHVWGYHAFNLAVHLLAAWALFCIIRRTLERENLKNRFGPSASGLATAASILWMVHPLQTQSINYVIQRAELLMGLFYLITLYSVIRSAESPHPRRWELAAVVACALGMGSKQAMVTAPITALLYDRLFIAPSWRRLFQQRKGLYLGLAATWGIQGIFLWKSLPQLSSFGVGFELPSLTAWEYLRSQPGVVLHYLKLSLWPEPLVFDYSWPVAQRWREILLPAIPLLALLGATGWALRRGYRTAFLGIWFFGILAPTSSFFPVADLAVEHRMYLPLAAVAAAAALAVHRLGLRKPLAGALALAAGLTLTALTILRNEDYRDEATLWADSLKKRPGNARAHNNLGIALTAQGKHREAIAHFSEAYRLKPRYADAYYNAALAFVHLGEYERAIPLYQEAIRIRPDDPNDYDALGHAFARQGNLEGALLNYLHALRLKPDFSMAQHHLEKVVALLGDRLQESPASPELQNLLGVALAGQGKFEEAEARFERALRLQKNFPQAHNNWGAALADQGKWGEAIAHFREALRLDPRFTNARDNLALAAEKQRAVR